MDSGLLLLMVDNIMIIVDLNFIYVGCAIDRATDVEVEKAGFSSLQQRKFDLPAREDSPIFFKVVRTFIKKHVLGVATK